MPAAPQRIGTLNIESGFAQPFDIVLNQFGVKPLAKIFAGNCAVVWPQLMKTACEVPLKVRNHPRLCEASPCAPRMVADDRGLAT
jgi:hypothetical protein